MELDFTEGMDTVGVPVIQMKHLHHDPRGLRYKLAKGSSFLLTHSFKLIAYMRPLTKEDLEEEMKKPEAERALMMTLEMVRTERDKFLYELQDGKDIHLFFKVKGNPEKTLALVTPQIPAKLKEAYAVFREMQLEDNREAKEKKLAAEAAEKVRAGKKAKG